MRKTGSVVHVELDSLDRMLTFSTSEKMHGSPGEMFGFGDEPFELPSAGFFSCTRTKARYA